MRRRFCCTDCCICLSKLHPSIIRGKTCKEARRRIESSIIRFGHWYPHFSHRKKNELDSFLYKQAFLGGAGQVARSSKPQVRSGRLARGRSKRFGAALRLGQERFDFLHRTRDTSQQFHSTGCHHNVVLNPYLGKDTHLIRCSDRTK